MTTLTVTEFSRNMSRFLDRIEHGGEEIVIVRNHHPIARILPGASAIRALDAFSDLFGILPDSEGEAWTNDMLTFDRSTAKELRDPWG